MIAVHLKDITILNYGKYVRFSISVSEKSRFVFTADEKIVRVIFEDEIIVGKRVGKKINLKAPIEKVDFNINGISVYFSRRFSIARYFVIPFPYKIIFDVGFGVEDGGMEIEDIIGGNIDTKPIVVIDAGHGGSDPGAIFGNIEEKDITFSIAIELAEILRKNFDGRVILTRDGDRFLSLEERSAIANSVNCDAFLSLHVNSAKSKKAKGIEIFYFSRTFSKYALYVASKENGVKLREEDMILFDIYSEEKEIESKKLASKIKKYLSNINKLRTIEGAPFYVLAGTFCPAVLVEVGFITNPYDRKKLISKSYLKSIAHAISNGIIDFLSSR